MAPLVDCSAVVFDLDGTLADTIGDITTALNRTLTELDLPPHSDTPRWPLRRAPLRALRALSGRA
jgi:phosphoglycolate phosphatase-like HAD superfamily hydrolase